MPNGRVRPWANSMRLSATPSPSESRSRKILLGLGLAEPTFFINIFWKKPLIPWFDLSAADGSDADSATSTSPFGRT